MYEWEEVYESDLPEMMGDFAYNVWYKLSRVDGVRVGPRYPIQAVEMLVEENKKLRESITDIEPEVNQMTDGIEERMCNWCKGTGKVKTCRLCNDTGIVSEELHPDTIVAKRCPNGCSQKVIRGFKCIQADGT